MKIRLNKAHCFSAIEVSLHADINFPFMASVIIMAFIPATIAGDPLNENYRILYFM